MKLIYVLHRDIGQQFAVSRNLCEGDERKVLRVFWCFLYLWKGIFIGLRGIWKEQLGSEVRYKGRKCTVSNWSGAAYPTLTGDGFYEQYCDRKEITNVRSVREYCHRFVTMFSWYMGSWYGIDVNKRLYGERKTTT